MFISLDLQCCHPNKYLLKLCLDPVLPDFDLNPLSSSLLLPALGVGSLRMGATCPVQGDELVVPHSRQHLWQISLSTQQLCYRSWVKGSSNNFQALPTKSPSILLLSSCLFSPLSIPWQDSFLFFFHYMANAQYEQEVMYSKSSFYIFSDVASCFF